MVYVLEFCFFFCCSMESSLLEPNGGAQCRVPLRTAPCIFSSGGVRASSAHLAHILGAVF